MSKILSIYSLLFFLFANTSVNAQTKATSSNPDLIPFRDGHHRQGYCNPKGDLVIFPEKYTMVSFFHGNTAIVTKGYESLKVKGMINRKGELILPVQFSSIDTETVPGYYLLRYAEYDENQKPAPNASRMVLRDKKGNEKMLPKYSKVVRLFKNLYSLEIFENGRTFLKLYGPGLNPVSDFKYNKITIFNNGYARVDTGDWRYHKGNFARYGYIDSNGRQLIPPAYIYLGNLTDAGTCSFHDNTKKMGMLDIHGKIILAKTYDSIWDFHEGRAVVMMRDSLNPAQRHFGFIDENGEAITKVIYSAVSNFKDGLAGVIFEEEKGFIDKNGKVVVAERYNAASEFEYGVSIVRRDKKWGIADSTGRIVVPLEYDDIQRRGKCVYDLMQPNGRFYKYGVYISRKNILVPIKYDWEIRGFFFGFTKVQADKKFGFLDTLGNEIVAPQYERVGDFSPAGYAMVGMDIREGLINTKGELVIPINYKDISYRNSINVQIVRKETLDKKVEVSFFNARGKEIKMPEGTNKAGEFSDGLCSVEMADGKTGYVDSTGKLVIPFSYDKGFAFHNGVAVVGRINKEVFGDNRIEYKYALINKQGHELTRFRYNAIQNVIVDGYDVIQVVVKDRFGYISKEGLEYFED